MKRPAAWWGGGVPLLGLGLAFGLGSSHAEELGRLPSKQITSRAELKSESRLPQKADAPFQDELQCSVPLPAGGEQPSQQTTFGPKPLPAIPRKRTSAPEVPVPVPGTDGAVVINTRAGAVDVKNPVKLAGKGELTKLSAVPESILKCH